MSPRKIPTLLMVLIILLGSSSCSQTPPEQAPYNQGFFYLLLSNAPTLMISDKPGGEVHSQIPINPPTDCTFFALHPAPVGRWIAVEWECSFGPAVELFDTSNGDSHFALSDPSIDSRFLAWQSDGFSLYTKIGTLSVPQTLRVDAATGKAVELQISAFSYDLTDSPDGKHVLYSLTKGIGFGSETWLAGPDGENPSQLLVDAANITALAQYSPDGSQIAYIKFADSQAAAPMGELWLMDANGFDTQRLASADAGRGFSPAWSPDGGKIAFVGRGQTDNPESVNLSIYDLKNKQLVTIPVGPFTQPVWSPDSALIVFGSQASISPGNSTTQTVTPGGDTPEPAGGDRINLWVYDLAGGKANILVNNACCAGWIH